MNAFVIDPQRGKKTKQLQTTKQTIEQYKTFLSCYCRSIKVKL